MIEIVDEYDIEMFVWLRRHWSIRIHLLSQLDLFEVIFELIIELLAW